MPRKPKPEDERQPEKRNATTLTPGDPRIPPCRDRYLAEGGVDRLRQEYEVRGLPVPENLEAPEPVADPMDELAAMERVLHGGKARTPLEKASAESLKKDQFKFMDRLKQLRGGGEATVSGETVQPDPGSQRALDLIESILAKAEAESRA